MNTGTAKTIMYCSTALSPGGELTWLRRTLDVLDRQRFRPLICSIRTPNASPNEIDLLGAEVILLEVKGGYNLLSAVRKMHRVVRENGVDVMHMTLFGTELVPFMVAMLSRVPLVATVSTSMDPVLVGGISGGRTTKLTLRVARFLQSVFARITGTEFIALSDHLKRSVKSHMRVAESNITLIGVGLNMRDFNTQRFDRDAALTGLGIDRDSPVIVNVGRLSKAKDQEAAIRAMPMVVDSFPSARFLVVGEGPLRGRLEQVRSELGLDKSVIFLGQRDDVSQLIQASDVFVFTSRYEGQPHAVVEAMAAGKPVVAFRIPATSDIIEDGKSGRLIDDRNTAALASEIVRLLDDENGRRIMGESAREIARTKFDISSNVRKIEDLYTRLTSSAA